MESGDKSTLKKMPKSGQYCDANNYLLKKNRELAVLSNSLSNMDRVGLLSPFCLPSRQPPPSQCPLSHPQAMAQKGKFSRKLKGQEVTHGSPRSQVSG